MRKIFITVLLGILSFSQQVNAQISVGNVIMHFAKGQRPVQNVLVSNSSDKMAYVLVETEVMVDPATDSNKMAPTEDLLVSPKAFSIEPKGQRTVRVLLSKPPTNLERVFRVGFVPQDRGFGEEVGSTQGKTSTVLRVLTGMGMLVFADPIKPEVKFEWIRENNEVRFFNKGNVQVFLGEIKSCSLPDLCTKHTSQRIYAGAGHRIQVPDSNTVTFLKKEGASGEDQNLTIPPKLK